MSVSEEIIYRVAREHGIGPRDLRGPGRHRAVAWPRQQAMCELRAQGLSLPLIGRILGHRDHTTVIHGIRAHQRRNGVAS